MFKLHTVLTKELVYFSLKLKGPILPDCNQQKVTEAKQSKHSKWGDAAWERGSSRLILQWPVGTGRSLTDEAIVVLRENLALRVDSEKRQLLRAARDIGTIFLLCLPPLDVLCSWSPLVWLVYLLQMCLGYWGFTSPWGSSSLAWLNTVRDQEEGPGGCCKLCPGITELHLYLIGFSYKKNPALTENSKGSSLGLSASMKRTNRTVNFNESQNTDCTID